MNLGTNFPVKTPLSAVAGARSAHDHMIPGVEFVEATRC
jgi:hypothetical protein